MSAAEAVDWDPFNPPPDVEVEAASPAVAGIDAESQVVVEGAVERLSAHLAPSTEAHLAALTAALPGGVGLPVVTSNRWRIAAVARRDDLGEALDVIVARQCREQIYVSTTALRDDRIAELRRGGGRGTAADAEVVACLFADIDHRSPAHASDRLPDDLGAALDVLADLPEPSMTVATGHGVQAWWLLDEPVTITEDSRADVKALADGWVRTVAHHAHRQGWKIDDGVGDLARILRVAGTYNLKTAPVRSTLLDVGGWPVGGLAEHGWQWRPGVRYSPAQLAEHVDPLPATAKRKRTSTSTATAVAARRDDMPRGWNLAELRDPRRAPNILDSVAAASWADIWPPDWEHVGDAAVDGEHVELWRRPGASSDYSAKCWPDGGALLWSDGVPGLDGGRDRGRYSKAELLAWRLGVDLSELSRSIIAEARRLAA